MKPSILALDSTDRAVERLREVPLGETARSLMEERFTPRQFLHGLIRAGVLYDALAVMVEGLSKREAVFWVCRCVRSVAGEEMPDVGCLEAAERWVADASEASRVRALEVALDAGCSTPAALAAAAAGWSGGSLLPAGADPVPPDARLTAQTVCAALALLLVHHQEEAKRLQRAFLQMGLDLVDGPEPWPAEPDVGAEGGGADAPGSTFD